MAAAAAAVAVAQADAVIHLAAISFVAHADVGEIYASNILGTRNLLEALSQSGVSGPVVVASSANVYGNRQSGRLDETMRPDPRSDYALSKLACEHLAAMYADRLATIVVRPFNYTGIGQGKQFLIPKIIDHIVQRAADIKLGNVDVARDFSDVRFVAEALCGLLSCPAAVGQTVNICSGRAVTITELLDLVREISGHDLKVRIDPALVRTQEVEQLWGSDTRLQGLIGPIECPPLAETLRWMLSAH
jgi:nucleoside-diphosphate-sugar epimerase